MQLDKGKFLEGFVAFGGGRYQCPGRWLAIAEMQLCARTASPQRLIARSFLIAFLGLFDIQPLTAAVSKPSTLHLVGSQEPAGPFDVAFTRLA